MDRKPVRGQTVPDDRSPRARHAAFQRARVQEAAVSWFEVPNTLGDVGTAPGVVLVCLPEDEAGPVCALLTADGHTVEMVAAPGVARQRAAAGDVDVVVLAGRDAAVASDLDAIRAVEGSAPPEVVVAGTSADAETAVMLMHRGAADYVVRPLAPNRLRLAVARAVERRQMRQDNAMLRQDLALQNAGQRLTETLDPAYLMRAATQALATFCTAHVAAVLSGEQVMDAVGLDPERIRGFPFPMQPGPPRHFVPAAVHASLAEFSDGRTLQLDERHQALVLRAASHPAQTFSRTEDVNLLILGRHIRTAMRNATRFTLVQRKASRDALSGLYNAAAMHEHTEAALTRAALTHAPVSMLFMDLDDFKRVNDTLGHSAGSRVLIEMARTLERCVRSVDPAGRFGGDEFVVLLAGMGVEEAHAVAERVRVMVQDHRFLTREGHNVAITVSVGVATFPSHVETAQALLDAADAAMYRAKAEGKNAVCRALSAAGAHSGSSG